MTLFLFLSSIAGFGCAGDPPSVGTVIDFEAEILRRGKIVSLSWDSYLWHHLNNEPLSNSREQPSSSSSSKDDATERFRQSALKENISVMRIQRLENMARKQIHNKVKAQFPTVIDELKNSKNKQSWEFWTRL